MPQIRIITWLNSPHECHLTDIMTFAKQAAGNNMRIVDECPASLVPNTAIVVWSGDATVSDDDLRQALVEYLKT